MVTDRQFRELTEKFNELSAKYAQMSKDIAAIQMKLDLVRQRKNEEPSQAHKDITKYLFMGKQLSKRDLVLTCIKQYIADTGITNPGLLFEVFPDHVQGPLGVFRKVEEAEVYKGAQNRYYFGDDDILHLDDGIYVVSKDWTAKNIGRFIDIMETLGYDIKPIIRD